MTKMSLPSLRSLMANPQYQAYMRRVRTHGNDANSPKQQPGLMTTARGLLKHVQECTEAAKQDTILQSGLAAMHDSLQQQATTRHAQSMGQAASHHKQCTKQASADHKVTMEAIGALGTGMEGAVSHGIQTYLGGGEIGPQHSHDEQIDLLLARKKGTAVALHAARAGKKQERAQALVDARAKAKAKGKAKGKAKSKAKSKAQGKATSKAKSKAMSKADSKACLGRGADSSWVFLGD